MITLYDNIKLEKPKDKLRLYREYSVSSFLLKQDLIKAMENTLYRLCDEDTHCFIVALKDDGKYILVEDYSDKGRISNEIIFKFAEEYDLRLESITHEVSEYFDDFSKEYSTSESNHHSICYEIQ